MKTLTTKLFATVGLGIYNPDTLNELDANNIVPEALPAVPAVGPKSKDVYQNVQVLGDLSVGEFTRLMAAITEWVSPEDEEAWRDL